MTNIRIMPETGYTPDPEAAWLVDACGQTRELNETPRQDPGWFHPSDLTCDDHELLARYMGTSVYRFEPAQKLRVYDNGTFMHRRWDAYLAAAEVMPEHVRRFELPYVRMRGECDGIVAHPETGRRYILELKSINPFGFGKLATPQDGHVEQVHCYMAGLGVLDTIVLYENKGDQAVRAFHVPFDLEVWTAIERRLIGLIRRAGETRRWEDDKPPELVEAALALKNELEGAPAGV